jgi:hypothetical protein
MDFSNFYTLVLTIAVVILILLLGYLGWIMSKQKVTDDFPKLKTSCPDFWVVSDDGSGKVFCQQPSAENALNKGKDLSGASGIIGNKFDTTDAGWASAGNAVCGKQKWANAQGISWDTVTNANYC